MLKSIVRFRHPRPDRSDEFASFQLPPPRKATMARAVDSEQPVNKCVSFVNDRPRPDPKPQTFRSDAWLRAVASLPCAHCRKVGETQAAHANHREKGMGTKAPDCLTFPLCVTCHREFDQGTTYTKRQRRELADAWIIETITELARMGLIRA